MTKKIIRLQEQTKSFDNSMGITDLYTKKFFKNYIRFPAIKLKFSNTKNSYLDKLLLSRQTHRKFSSTTVKFEEMSNLLYYCFGIRETNSNWDETSRPYPSAGARYPLEIYLVNINIKGLEKGIYHYELKSNSLELMYKNDDIESLMEDGISGNKYIIENPSFYIIITAVEERVSFKYGNRSFRFIYLEAGHAGQNIMLKAEELGLGTTPIGGFNDKIIINLLDIVEKKEFPTYIFSIGKKT